MGIFDMLKKMNPDSRIFGFLMGPHGVYSNNYLEICEDYMNLYRNTGGFDMICKYQSSHLLDYSAFVIYHGLL
jgi:6-phosphofructokinase